MGELVDIAFSFPAIIFTISTLILVCFWASTTLIGGGFDLLDGVDANLEGGAHVELDLELEPGIESSDGVNPSDASAGLLRSTLQFLGIIGMPLLLALNLLSLFAWALTMIAVTVIGPSSIGLVIGLVVTVGAFAASGFITGRVANRNRRRAMGCHQDRVRSCSTTRWSRQRSHVVGGGNTQRHRPNTQVTLSCWVVLTRAVSRGSLLSTGIVRR